MGDIVGGIIGGIGSIFGGNAAAKKEDEAAKSALTGYNYLNTNALINQAQTNASTAITNQNTALGNESGTLGDIQQLLTSNGTSNPAFQNYLNSTGYNFNLQQGENAITGNAAAKGVLNSGATAKALTSYGTNLANNYFNTYLGQLGGLASSQGGLASAYGGQVGQGLTAANAVGQAGTTGGNNAGNFQAQAGQSEGTSLTNAFNIGGGTLQNIFPSSSNFFASAVNPLTSLVGLF